ncbi:MAG: hypothetical protein MK165_15800 [Pirellulaceae bacterium]|nr:hypothetical protein [Pirellulaceae bacterium]
MRHRHSSLSIKYERFQRRSVNRIVLPADDQIESPQRAVQLSQCHDGTSARLRGHIPAD